MDAMRTLKAQGRRIGIISNKPDSAVNALADALFPGLTDIAVGDRPGEETVYIGDSDVDVRTAHAAGVRCVSVTWGFRDRDELVAAGAETFADDCTALLRVLEA